LPREKPKYLKLERQDAHSWAFNRPSQWEFLDHKLERALAAERNGDKEEAIRIYLELVEACPEYISALNNLGLLFREQDDLDGAITTLEEAVEIGLACLPDEFEAGTDTIPWYWEDNRPFLLAYENLGSCYLEQALDAYEHLLELNPHSRGIAELVAKLREICGVEDESIE
jgi:tetratricopeptide (TPR) repeat protein